LEAVELAICEVTYSKRVADAAQKDGRIVNPSTLGGYVTEGKSAAMISSFLFKNRVLLTLADDCSLIGTEDLVGLGNG
jgi:hypothetical protein